MRSARGCWGPRFRRKEVGSAAAVRLCCMHAQCTVLSSRFLISQSYAEALDKCGGRTKHRLIPYFFSNTSAKNYRNVTVYVKNYSKSKVGRFWDTVYMQSPICTRLCHVLEICMQIGTWLEDITYRRSHVVNIHVAMLMHLGDQIRSGKTKKEENISQW